MREAVRIVGDCRALGADSSAWHTHALDRLRDLTRSQVAIGANLRDFVPGRTPRGVSVQRLGWPSPTAEEVWRDYVNTVPVQRTPEYGRLVGFVGPIVTRTRAQLWDDRTWYRSRNFNEYHRASGIDHYIFSIARTPRPNLFNTIWLHRPVGDPRFTWREWWLVRLVHGELGAMVGGALAPADEPNPSSLPRRQRQTLDLLLDGLSEKQIAARLGLSRPTVHEYITALYRRWGVSSRGELMGRFVGRARPQPAPGPPVFGDPSEERDRPSAIQRH